MWRALSFRVCRRGAFSIGAAFCYQRAACLLRSIFQVTSAAAPAECRSPCARSVDRDLIVFFSGGVMKANGATLSAQSRQFGVKFLSSQNTINKQASQLAGGAARAR